MKGHVSGKILLIALELLLLEVLNTLRYKGHDERALEKANLALWNIQLHLEHTNSSLLQRAVGIALKYHLTIYDAVYMMQSMPL